MKAKNEAAGHDRWFREQVEQGLREAEDPAAEWVPHEDVMARLDARIARLKTRGA
jgi:predicted transcriptional regulator